MSDRKTAVATSGDAPAATSVSAEIGRSVGSIWQKRTGTRPANVNTEINGDAIKCVIEAGEPAPVDPEAEVDPDAPAAGGTDTNSYRHEANAAVARITKRTVSAYISKLDKKTGLSTETFILERVRTKY
jgi:hypothetical protein